jgi:hypothetical protein
MHTLVGRNSIAIAIFLALLSASCSAVAQTASSSASTVSNLTLVSSWTPTSGQYIRDVVADGNNAYLYAAAGYNGILCFQISNSSNLIQFATNLVITNYPVNDILIKEINSREYLFAVLGTYNGMGGIAIYDITAGPAGAVLTNGTNTVAGVSGNSAYMNASTGLIYVADEFMGIQIYTNFPVLAPISNGPAMPLNGHSGIGIDSLGTYAVLYVAAADGGVYIVNSSSMTVLAQISSPVSIANSVRVNQNTLAVADQSGYIWFYNIAIPSNPQMLGSYFIGGQPTDIAINGSDVFVAAGSQGVVWIDITSTSVPVLKGASVPSGRALKLNVPTGNGGYFYAAYGLDGIRVFQYQ